MAARRLAAAVALALLASCGTPAVEATAAPVEFTVGGMTFRAASGAARVSGGVLSLYLSDQVDTCDAILRVPVGTVHLLALRVAPAVGGATRAAVGAPTEVPGPGEAGGRLTEATGGAVSRSFDTASGSVVWTAAADGSATVTALDVGFSGTADRMATAQPLWLRSCP